MTWLYFLLTTSLTLRSPGVLVLFLETSSSISSSSFVQGEEKQQTINQIKFPVLASISYPPIRILSRQHHHLYTQLTYAWQPSQTTGNWARLHSSAIKSYPTLLPHIAMHCRDYNFEYLRVRAFSYDDVWQRCQILACCSTTVSHIKKVVRGKVLAPRVK